MVRNENMISKIGQSSSFSEKPSKEAKGDGGLRTSLLTKNFNLSRMYLLVGIYLLLSRMMKTYIISKNYIMCEMMNN